MGFLSGVASIIITARLNAGASVTGTLTELNVIAAAVIGGTSLAGGIGTIYGAVLGAVFMQSLENGMVLLGIPTPVQKMVLAVVLILAVWIDHGSISGAADMSAPLVELRGISKTFGGRPRARESRRRSGRRRSHRAARPQRRRQVDTDQDAFRRLSGGSAARSAFPGSR